MEQINDLYKIINNKYSNETNSIYEQILEKEENVRNTIDRVIKLKDDEKLNELFTNTSIENIFIKIFKILNSILDEMNETENLTYKQFKKIMKKNSRIIYIGIFLIVLAVSLLLIEISDNI